MAVSKEAHGAAKDTSKAVGKLVREHNNALAMIFDMPSMYTVM